MSLLRFADMASKIHLLLDFTLKVAPCLSLPSREKATCWMHGWCCEHSTSAASTSEQFWQCTLSEGFLDFAQWAAVARPKKACHCTKTAQESVQLAFCSGPVLQTLSVSVLAITSCLQTYMLSLELNLRVYIWCQLVVELSFFRLSYLPGWYRSDYFAGTSHLPPDYHL